MRRIAIVLVVAALGGCSSTPADLEQSTESVTKSYEENYQEIYRRVSSSATRCWGGNVNAYASVEVDAQLYSELGFGEVSMSLSNLGTRNYYWSAKVERAGDGSMMTLHAGNTLSSSQLTQAAIRWAAGDPAC